MDAREVLSKLPKIATTNGDVPFTFSDGTQIALPGLPKLKAEVDGFINDAEAMIKGWWNRILYVHPDGDDNAPGTEDAPLTLEGAIAAIPPGGKGWLRLLSDYVISKKIDLGDTAKNFVIDGYAGGEVRKLKFKIMPRGDYNTVMGFTNLGGCNIGLYYTDITFVDERDTNKPFDSYTQCFDYKSYTSGVFSLHLERSTVTLPDIFPVTIAKANGAGTSLVVFCSYKSKIITQGDNSYAFEIGSGSIVYNPYDLQLEGAKTSHSDLFIGIVRDSNGIPRNILSSVVI
jgi:hypothetical protein